MTFGITLGDNLMIAASVCFMSQLTIIIKQMLKATASNIKIKIYQLFSKTADSRCPCDGCTAGNLSGLDTNLLLNNV